MEQKEKIIEKWRPTHEKGMKAYVLPFALKYLGAVALLMVIFFVMPHQQDPERTMSLVACNILLYGMAVYVRVRDWLKNENQYQDALKSLNEKKGHEETAVQLEEERK